MAEQSVERQRTPAARIALVVGLMCVATLVPGAPVVVALFLMHRTRSNEPYLTKWIIATALFATTLQVGLLKFPQAEGVWQSPAMPTAGPTP